MNIQDILQNTFNPDRARRQEAEASLAAFLTTSGALATLLGIASDHNSNRDLRLASSIAIKNKIGEFFRPENAHMLVDADKEVVKHMVLQSLWTEADNSIRSLFGEIVKKISEYEYPDRLLDLYYIYRMTISKTSFGSPL